MQRGRGATSKDSKRAKRLLSGGRMSMIGRAWCDDRKPSQPQSKRPSVGHTLYTRGGSERAIGARRESLTILVHAAQLQSTDIMSVDRLYSSNNSATVFVSGLSLCSTVGSLLHMLISPACQGLRSWKSPWAGDWSSCSCNRWCPRPR